MAEGKHTLVKEKTVGDTAVDGLLAGIMAGIVAAVFLLVAGLISGQMPGSVLARFDPTLEGSTLMGGLMHLAISAVYGALFAVLVRPLGRRWPRVSNLGWLLGAFYGLVLMFLAKALFITGLNSGLREFTTFNFAAFHIIYGIVLGFIVSRANRAIDM